MSCEYRRTKISVVFTEMVAHGETPLLKMRAHQSSFDFVMQARKRVNPIFAGFSGFAGFSLMSMVRVVV